jgi:hypothetical protein
MMTLAVLVFILVHGPDGQEIELNVSEISSIRQPRETEGHFNKDVHCVIFMTNGKFVGVEESCGDILIAVVKTEKENPK